MHKDSAQNQFQQAKCWIFPGGKVGIRPLGSDDRSSFLRLVTSSEAFHGLWIQPPKDEPSFQALLDRTQDASFEALALVLIPTGELIGMVHLSQIFRGAFQSAYCSYWVGYEFQRKGYMTEALRLTLHFAFRELGLHRLEANLQPKNLASIALIRRCGFVKEGFSEKYLQIEGEWKDHERWAIHQEIWIEKYLAAEFWPYWN